MQRSAANEAPPDFDPPGRALDTQPKHAGLLGLSDQLKQVDETDLFQKADQAHPIASEAIRPPQPRTAKAPRPEERSAGAASACTWKRDDRLSA